MELKGSAIYTVDKPNAREEFVVGLRNNLTIRGFQWGAFQDPEFVVADPQVTPADPDRFDYWIGDTIDLSRFRFANGNLVLEILPGLVELKDFARLNKVSKKRWETVFPGVNILTHVVDKNTGVILLQKSLGIGRCRRCGQSVTELELWQEYPCPNPACVDNKLKYLDKKVLTTIACGALAMFKATGKVGVEICESGTPTWDHHVTITDLKAAQSDYDNIIQYIQQVAIGARVVTEMYWA